MPHLDDDIQQMADQCVRCGLCLPHCPTYLQTEQEGESPRGRIALWQGMASGQLPLTDRAQDYLDHCLACGACEAVCPAEVAYGQLLVAGRAWQMQQGQPAITRKRRWQKKMIAFFIRFPHLLQLAKFLLPFMLPHLPRAQPRRPLHRQKIRRHPALTSSARVVLAPGCVHKVIDAQTLIDSQLLLQACGYEVIRPAHFRCCGAWSAHNGDTAAAEYFCRQNQRLFQNHAALPILSTATGCTTTLQRAALQTRDIGDFLLQAPAFAALKFSPLPEKALLHIPCTQRNDLKQPDVPWRLLQSIPQLTLLPLAVPHCCGGAGSYFLEFPQQASDLARAIVQQVQQQDATLLITSNVGCAVHLQQQLQQAGSTVRVQHPVNILAQQLIVTC